MYLCVLCVMTVFNAEDAENTQRAAEKNAQSLYGLVTLTSTAPFRFPLGSMLIVNSPVAFNVCVDILKFKLLEVDVVCCDPSGLSSLTVIKPMALFVNRTVTCCPEVPLKVTFAFWPGTVVVTFTAVALMVVGTAGSAGTS